MEVFFLLYRHNYNRRSIGRKLSRRVPFGFTRTDPDFQYHKHPIPESTIHSRESSLLDLPLSTWDTRSEPCAYPKDPNHIYARPTDEESKTATTTVAISDAYAKPSKLENGQAPSTLALPDAYAKPSKLENGRAPSTIAMSDVYPIDVTSL